jgi:putative LysE/RhtB family amino acid efflux pump
LIELVGAGLLIGAIVGAPIGPIGTATFIHAMAGHTRTALGGVAGCVVAEISLAVLAIANVVLLKNYLTDLPQVDRLGIGIVLLFIGLYYLLARQLPRPGAAASFLIAFKITLLSPQNILALMALIAAMGLAAKLNSVSHAAAFIFGELISVTAYWIVLVCLGLRMRNNDRVKVVVPWFRRGVGAFMMLAAIGIIAGRI